MSEEFWDVQLVGSGLRNKRIRIPLCRRRNAKVCFRNSIQKHYVFRYKAVWRISPLLDEKICMLRDSVSNMPNMTKYCSPHL